MQYRIKIAKGRDFGETDFKKRVIKINKKKSIARGKKLKKPELLDTIYHEKYHADHPKATENTARKKTKAFIKKATKKQKSRTYKLAQNQYYISK